MELRHLRYFVTVAEELNVSRASARLRVSQPAVSRQIRDLEEELGVALFVRETGGLSLTPAGQSYLVHARSILRQSAEASLQMQSFREKRVSRLRVSYLAPMLTRFLTMALKQFTQNYPRTEVVLKELSPLEQIKALREQQVDLAFIGNPYFELEKEFDFTVIQQIPLQAVLPQEHRLVHRKRIDLVELKEEAFVGFDEQYFPGRNLTLCQACQQSGFTPRFTVMVENLNALLAMIATGKGITLAPEELSQLPHPQVNFVSLKPPIPQIVSVAVFQKNGTDSALQELLNLCKTFSSP